MALFRKKPEKMAKVLEEENEEEVSVDETSQKPKKMQQKAPKEELQVEKEEGLTEEVVINALESHEERLQKLEKHCLMVGWRE